MVGRSKTKCRCRWFYNYLRFVEFRSDSAEVKIMRIERGGGEEVANPCGWSFNG